MMVDPRTKHLRTLRRRQRAARRWSVVGGGLTGAAAILAPYAGLGLPDVFWAAGAGMSAVLAVWRWRDYREIRALPVPEPMDPALQAAERRRKVISAVSSVPIGNTAITELRRHRARLKYRGLAVAPLWQRLDRAAVTFAGLVPRLTGFAAPTVAEAVGAQNTLFDLVERAAGVERTMQVAPPDSKAALSAAQTELMGQLKEGVEAYERLVAAAAGYIAEDGRMGAKFLDPAAARLTEAADRLRGYSTGLSELRGLS